MRYRCVDAHKAAGFPVVAACQAARVSASAFYAWAAKGEQGQQGLDALPQLVGQQAVGQGGHGPGSSHHPAQRIPHPRFRNAL